MSAGASNSDVQYVAYLKAKFNLADADLLQVIALSQRPSDTPSPPNVLSSAPEGEEEIEVIEDSEEHKDEMDASYEEVMDDESYEEVEYMEESFTDRKASPAAPVPAPMPYAQTDEQVAIVPGATSQALVPVDDAFHDETPPVRFPEDVSQSMVRDDAPHDEANALAIVPAKSQPVPEQAPPVDEELAIVPAKKKRPAASPPIQRDQPEEKDNSLMYMLIGLCLILVIAVAVILILIFVTETIPKFWENDPDPIVMEPYVPGNCNFGGQTQPNVVSQCECTGRVSEVNEYTQEQYNRLTQEFLVPNIYQTWNYDISSCEPENQAALWLSTGKVIEDELDLTQRYSVALLYYSTSGEQWTAQEDWMSEEDVCDWYGLSCTGDELKDIQLPSNRVDGEVSCYRLVPDNEKCLLLYLTLVPFCLQIPSELSFLTRLETLALDTNTLSSTIPTSLFSIPSLTTLTLSANQLIGSIPTHIGLARGLESLRLDDNRIRDEIPTELNRLTRLASLNLANNTMLTGRIATEYGLFTDLETLSLSNTDIRARIPSEYGLLTNLLELNIANTLVGGEIPIQFSQLTRLRILDFSGSRLRQTVPTFLGRLTDLSKFVFLFVKRQGWRRQNVADEMNFHFLYAATLMLGNNELNGPIPTELGSLTRLRSLDLHGNAFEGFVPTELANLRSLSKY